MCRVGILRRAARRAAVACDRSIWILQDLQQVRLRAERRDQCAAGSPLRMRAIASPGDVPSAGMRSASVWFRPSTRIVPPECPQRPASAASVSRAIRGRASRSRSRCTRPARPPSLWGPGGTEQRGEVDVTGDIRINVRRGIHAAGRRGAHHGKRVVRSALFPALYLHVRDDRQTSPARSPISIVSRMPANELKPVPGVRRSVGREVRAPATEAPAQATISVRPGVVPRRV